MLKVNPRNSEKTDQTVKVINELMTEYLSHPTLIVKIVKIQMTERDLFNKTVLSYFEQYNAYTQLQSSIINEVMIDLSKGVAELQGSFLQDSTLSTILFDKGLFKDFE